MADEATVIETPPVETPPSIVSADGTFNEGWQTHLSEELQNEPSLKVFSTVDALAAGFVSTKKMVGKDTVATPTDNFSDQEWDDWHKAGGRPETPEDYNIKRPEEIAEEHWDTDFANAAQTLFHQAGLSSSQVNKITEFWNNKTITQRKNQDTEHELMMTELQSKLHQKWGGAYDQNIHVGNLAIDKGINGDEDLKSRLLQTVGNNVDFIEFAANIGKMFTESKVIHDTEIPAPADWDEKIAEASGHPAYIDGTNPQHKVQVDKVNRLIEAKNKSIGKVTELI